jgi:protein translocase SecG subunit
MRIALTIIMIIAGLLLIWSVLLMSPKGWLWLGLWWMSNSGEYGSKKTIEGTLKKVALISSILFAITALILPYTLRG